MLSRSEMAWNRNVETISAPLTKQIPGVSIMAKSNLARILRISQELNHQFYDINHYLSKSWHVLESARGNVASLQLLYDEWLECEKLHKQEQD